MDVTIKKINLLGSDERGATYDFATKKTGEFLFLTRKAGSLSGNSYHEGKNAGTAPKTFIVLSGEVEFIYRHIDASEVSRLRVNEPSIVEIQPFIIHSVLGITDFMMLEANSIQDIRDDRIKEPVER